MKNIHVVAAIIMKNNKVLCAQRGDNKYEYISRKFEFPGGKIETGESDEEALKREIYEELSINIQEVKFYTTIKHQYPDFHLNISAYKCKCKNSKVRLSEHIDFKWLRINELSTLDWLESDIPIINKLKLTG